MAKFLAQKGPVDPSLVPTACEICGEVKPLRDMLSIGAVYRMPGFDHYLQLGLPPFGCPDKQHFGCCHDHALLAMIYCLFEHLHEGPHIEQGKDIEHPVLQDIVARLEQHIDDVTKEVSLTVQESNEVV
jgi:hypothetical protein